MKNHENSEPLQASIMSLSFSLTYTYLTYLRSLQNKRPKPKLFLCKCWENAWWMFILQYTCKSCILYQELWQRLLAIGISRYKTSTEIEPAYCCSFQGTFGFPEFALPGSNRRTATVNLLHNALFPESWNARFPQPTNYCLKMPEGSTSFLEAAISVRGFHSSK